VWLQIKLATRNIFRNKRRTFIAGFAIGIGLAALIFTDALVIGMENNMIASATESFMGEGQIHHTGFRESYDVEETIVDPDDIIRRLKQEPMVAHFTPRTLSFAMIASPANVSSVTMVGIDPETERYLSQIDEARAIAEECTQLPVHPRHPYAGELVYTAFSGSHQDAIKKGMYAQERSNSEVWDVPYLPIDPKDVGRTYEAIIRVNSQSGKGGVAYLMEAEHGLELPRGLQIDFAQKVQAVTDAQGGELTAAELLGLFEQHYLAHTKPYELLSYSHASSETDNRLAATMLVDGESVEIEGHGNGPIAVV